MYPHQSLLHRPLGVGMVGMTKELISRNLLKNPVGLLNLLSKCKSFTLVLLLYSLLCAHTWKRYHCFILLVIANNGGMISGSTNYFSTTQSKQQKNKSDGPKGKTPEEDEGQ